MSHAFETLTNEFVANDFSLLLINEFVAFNIKYLPGNLLQLLGIFCLPVAL